MRSLIEDNPEAIDIGPNGTSLDLLQAVYRSNDLPLHTRMRAAISALPHEVPRLAVQALITEQDIATVLDRRIAHYQQLELANNGAKLIDAQPINGKPQAKPQIETKPPPARTPDRRFRRI
jgi:hypothetical protein